MNSSKSSTTSSTSRYSLLAHEFDTLSPAPDDPPILEREDNSDLSTPAETSLQSSPVSSFTNFSTFPPTSPEDTARKQTMLQSYPFPRPCTPEFPKNQGLVYDGGSEAELDGPATPPTTTYVHLVQDKREEASWTQPEPGYQRKRGFPGRARRRFGRVVREAFRGRE